MKSPKPTKGANMRILDCISYSPCGANHSSNRSAKGVRVREHVYIQEDGMDKSHAYAKGHTLAIMFAVLGLIALIAAASEVRIARAQSNSAASLSDSDLIAQFRRVEVASVSDALEQITGKRMYMSHRMQPIFTAKFAGFARTVQLKKDEGNSDPAALSGMLAAIDQGSTDDVYVMAVEDGQEIAGMGGLVGKGMAARGDAGGGVGGGCRNGGF